MGLTNVTEPGAVATGCWHSTHALKILHLVEHGIRSLPLPVL